MIRALRDEVAAFSTVPVQMSERANMKVRGDGMDGTAAALGRG